jgi:hypothetical protein
MKREIQDKKRYLLALIIGTVIFLIGFGITYAVSYLEYQSVVGMQDPLSYQIFQNKLQYSLFGEDICSDESYSQISMALAIQGGFIGDLEDKLGKNNKDVLFRKKFYSLIELEHFEFVKIINKECNKKINTILFFYSNEDEEIDSSEEFGSILGVLHQRNEGNLVIYSFDTNLESEIIVSLKEKYGVKGPRFVILNEDQEFTSISNIEDIESLLL